MHNLPPSLKSRFLGICQLKQSSIVLPESLDPRVLTAVEEMVANRAARYIFLCTTQAEGHGTARSLGLHPERWSSIVRWVPDEFPDLPHRLEGFYRRRMQSRGKVVDDATARTFGQSPLNQAGYLVAEGHAATALAGCVATTAEVIRAALHTVGLAPGIKTISGSFLMDRRCPGLDQRTLMFADCGVVIEPTLEQLVDIAAASVATFRKLVPDEKPAVAFLSFSTKGSAQHPASEKMAAAAHLFQQRYPAIAADGELQFDAAIVPEIGARKSPGSPVAGRANCFIFPDLGAGNIAYKITQRLGLFDAYGPILQGTAKPFSDLSRGASADDIVMSAYIGMVRDEGGTP